MVFFEETIYYRFTRSYGREVDIHAFDHLKQQRNPESMFKMISRRTDGPIDLSVIGRTGQHLAYAGPYNNLTGMSGDAYIINKDRMYQKSLVFPARYEGHQLFP